MIKLMAKIDPEPDRETVMLVSNYLETANIIIMDHTGTPDTGTGRLPYDP